MNQGEPSRRGFLRKTGIAAAGLAVESKAQAGQRSNATGESSFDVREFGAKADGNSLDTPAINKAIETAAHAGGGRVVFPAGTLNQVTEVPFERWMLHPRGTLLGVILIRP